MTHAETGGATEVGAAAEVGAAGTAVGRGDNPLPGTSDGASRADVCTRKSASNSETYT